MMSEVLCIEVTDFFVYLSSSYSMGKKNQTGSGEFGFGFTLKQSDQWKNTTVEQALKKSDLMGIFLSFERSFCVFYFWVKICWQQGWFFTWNKAKAWLIYTKKTKIPLLLTRQTRVPSNGIWYGTRRLIAPNSSLAWCYEALGEAGEWAHESPRLPPNRASCLQAMQLFLHCVQYQLESNANYLRRAFQGSQL